MKDMWDKHKEGDEELIAMIPDGHIVTTNTRTGEKFVSLEHYKLIVKISNKRLDLAIELIENIIKDSNKEFKKLTKQIKKLKVKK